MASGLPPHRGLPLELLTELRPGSHVLTSEWAELFAEGRLRTRAYASERRRRSRDGAWSHATAAALHGLPLYGAGADRVELTVAGIHPRRNARDVIRHHAPLPVGDVEEIGGLIVTSLLRTIYDVIRTRSLVTAVVCTDAALRRIAWDDDTNTYDVERAERFRASLRRRVADNPGARGIIQARLVTEFADGRAQLPGESVSRLWMWQLGVPAPVLQHRVDLGEDRYALLDFAWPAAGIWAEFDGRIKYENPTILAGRGADEVLLRQRERERAVARATGWTCERWGFDDMRSLDEFGAYLRGIGLWPGSPRFRGSLQAADAANADWPVSSLSYRRPR